MADASPDEGLETLLEHLRRARAVDFRNYKRASLGRRIAKRMGAVGAADYEAYVAYLQEHPDEFEVLFNTILINVTAFFRDRVAWDYLRGTVIPEIAARDEEAPIRVWSAACATGQEAYSVAMLLAEALGEERFRSTVKIYATDVDDEALVTARHAWYPAKELAAVPDDLRDRCFDLNGGGGTFRPELRRAVIFGRHDLLQDPPISRIDLLICRNALMYFTADAQTRVLRQFSFALRDSGYLFLGKSEVLLSRTALFQPEVLRHRVFRNVSRSSMTSQETPPVVAESQPPNQPEPAALIDAAFSRAPIGQIVVNPAGALVLANEQARRMFGLSPNDIGRPIQDLEVSYRPVELRSRIEEVHDTRRPVRIAGVEWH